METNGFLYEMGMMGEETPKPQSTSQRKFGTDLTRSVKANGRRNQDNTTLSVKQSTTTATTTTTRKNNNNNNNSTVKSNKKERNGMNSSTPQPIKSRFHSSTRSHIIARNLDREGTFLTNNSNKSTTTTAISTTTNNNTTNTNNTNTNIVTAVNNEANNTSQTSVPTLPSTTTKQTYKSKLNQSHQSMKSYHAYDEYTVVFQPGPIGMKLEPIIQSNSSSSSHGQQQQQHSQHSQQSHSKDFGCRVSYINPPPSQAYSSGKIRVRDVLVAIDGKNICSNTYADIIDLLRDSNKVDKERKIKFKRLGGGSVVNGVSNGTSTGTSIGTGTGSNGGTTTTVKSHTAWNPSMVHVRKKVYPIADVSHVSIPTKHTYPTTTTTTTTTTNKANTMSNNNPITIYSSPPSQQSPVQQQQQQEQQPFFSPSFVKTISKTNRKSKRRLASSSPITPPPVLESLKILAKRFIGDVVNRRLYYSDDDNDDIVMGNMISSDGVITTMNGHVSMGNNTTTTIASNSSSSGRMNQVSTHQLEETVQVKMQVLSELNQVHDAIMMDSSTNNNHYGVDGLPSFSNVSTNYSMNDSRDLVPPLPPPPVLASASASALVLSNEHANALQLEQQKVSELTKQLSDKNKKIQTISQELFSRTSLVDQLSKRLEETTEKVLQTELTKEPSIEITPTSPTKTVTTNTTTTTNAGTNTSPINDIDNDTDYVWMVADLQDKLEEQTLELQTFKEQNLAKQENIHLLEEKVSSLNVIQEQTNEKLVELRRQKVDMTEARAIKDAEAQTERNVIENEIRVANSTVQEQEMTIQSLESMLKKRNQVVQQRDSLLKKVAEMEISSGQLERELQVAKDSLDVEKSTIQNLESTHQSKIGQLQSTIDEKNVMLEQLSNDIGEKKVTISGSLQNQNRLSQEKDDLLRKISEMEKVQQDQITSSTKLEEELRLAKDTLEQQTISTEKLDCAHREKTTMMDRLSDEINQKNVSIDQSLRNQEQLVQERSSLLERVAQVEEVNQNLEITNQTRVEKLQSTIGEKDSMLDQLTNDISDKEASIANTHRFQNQLAQEKDYLLRKISEMEKVHQDQIMSCSELEKELQIAKDTLENQTISAEKLDCVIREKIEELQTIISEKDTMLNHLSDEINQKSLTIDKSLTDKEHVVQEKDILLEKLSHMEKLYREQNMSLKQSEEELRLTRTSLEEQKMTSQMLESTNLEKVEELHSVIQGKDLILDQLVNDADEKKASVAKLIHDRDQLVKEKDSLLARVSDLEQSYQDQTASSNQLEGELQVARNSLQEQLHAVKNSESVHEENLARLQHAIQEKDNTLEQLSSDLIQINSSLTDSLNGRDQLAQEKNALTERIYKMQEIHLDQKMALDKLEEELRVAKHSMEGQSTEMTDIEKIYKDKLQQKDSDILTLKEDVHRKELCIAKSDRERSNLRNERDRLSQQMVDIEKDMADLLEENQSTNDTLEQQRVTLQSLQKSNVNLLNEKGESEALKNHISNMQISIDSAMNERNQLIGEKDRLLLQVSNVEEAYGKQRLVLDEIVEKLRVANTSLEQQNVNMKSFTELHQKELQQKKDEVRHLEDNIDTKEGTISDLMKERKELLVQKECLSQELINTESLRQRDEVDIAKLKEELQMAVEQKLKMKYTESTFHQTVDELEAAVREKDSLVQQLTDDISTMQSSITDHVNDLNRLEDEKDSLQKKLSDLEKINHSQLISSGELEEKLLNVNKSLEEKHLKIEDMESNYQEKINELEVAIHDKDKVLESLRDDIENNQISITESNNERSQLEDARDRLEDKLMDQSRTLKEMQASVDEKQLIIENLQEGVNRKEALITESINQRDQLSHVNDNLKAQLSNASKAHTDLANSTKYVEITNKEQIEELRKDMEEKNSLLKTLNCEVTTLTCERDLLVEEKDDLLKKISEVEMLYHTEKENIRVAQNDQTMELKMLESRYKGKVSQLETTIFEKDSILQELTGNLSDQQVSISQCMNERDEAVDQKNSSAEKYRIAIEAKELEMKKLEMSYQDDLKKIELEIQEKNSTMKDLRKDMSIQQTAIARFQSTIEQLEKKLRISGQSNEDLRIEAESLHKNYQDKIEKMEFIIKKDEAILEELRDDISSKKLSMNDSMNERNQLAEEKSRLEEKLRVASGTIDYQVLNIDALNNSLKEKDLSIEQLQVDLDQAQIYFDDLMCDYQNVVDSRAAVSQEVVEMEYFFQRYADSMKMESSCLQIELINTNADLDEQRADIQRIDDSHREEVNSVVSVLRDQEQLIDKLQQDLRQKQILVEDIDRKCQSISEEKGKLLEYINQMKVYHDEQSEALEVSLSSLEGQVSLSKKMIEEQQTIIRTYEDKQEECSNKINQLQNTLQSAGKQISDDAKMIGELENDCADCRIEVSSLSEQNIQLEAALESFQNEIIELEKQHEEKIVFLEEKCNLLDDEHQGTKSKLLGVEKLALIHDKECARLLNDIGSKSNEIDTINSLCHQLEFEKREAEGEVSRLQALLSSQNELLSNVEKELGKKDMCIHDLRSRADSEVEKGDYLTSQIDTLQNDLKCMQEKAAAVDKMKQNMQALESDLSSKSKGLEWLKEQLLIKNNDVHRLYSTINELQGVRNENESLSQDLLSIKSELKAVNDFLKEMSMKNKLPEFKGEDEKTVAKLQRLIDCYGKKITKENSAHDPTITTIVEVQGNDDENTDAPSIFSPTSADIVAKHSDLLNDLIQMKSAIQDAFTPEKSSNFDIQKQKEDNERCEILVSIEEKINCLSNDFSITKRFLSDNETQVKNLLLSIDDYQKEKTIMREKLNSTYSYVHQIEEALSHELKRRSQLEKQISMLKQKVNNDNPTDKENKRIAAQKMLQVVQGKLNKDVNKAFRVWSCETCEDRAKEENLIVANQMANQLKATQQKVFALKSHLAQRR